MKTTQIIEIKSSKKACFFNGANNELDTIIKQLYRGEKIRC